MHYLRRGFQFGFQQFRRNLGLSLLTISLLILPLVTVNVIILLGFLGNQAVEVVKEKVNVVVFLKNTTTPEQAQDIVSGLSTLTSVKSAVYESPEEVLAAFRSRHLANQNIQDALVEIGDNPFGGTVTVTATDPKYYPELMGYLDTPTIAGYIEQKSYDDHEGVITRIQEIRASARAVGVAVVFVFGVIAVLIILNSIRMGVYAHREEIGIMRLVGASSFFIRLPFWVEMLIFSSAATVISVLALFPLLTLLEPYVISFFDGAQIDIIGYFVHNGLIIFGLQWLGLLAVCLISATLAMRRYLRV